MKAAILRDGEPLARKSEYFTCAPSVHQILQLGSGRHWGWQFTGRPYPFENYAEIFAQEDHATYGKASGGGPVGYEKLRRAPDLAGYAEGRFRRDPGWKDMLAAAINWSAGKQFSDEVLYVRQK